VQVANHGREALQELTKTKYWRTPTIAEPFNLSVVLMDVEMPILDGNAEKAKSSATFPSSQ
jgi:CheY-like chemotaxis protein